MVADGDRGHGTGRRGTNVPVVVTVAGQTSNVLDFSYDPPSITSVKRAPRICRRWHDRHALGYRFRGRRHLGHRDLRRRPGDHHRRQHDADHRPHSGRDGERPDRRHVDGRAAGRGPELRLLELHVAGLLRRRRSGAGHPGRPRGSTFQGTATSELEAQPGYYDPGTGNVAPIPADPGYFIGAVGQAAETPAPAVSSIPAPAMSPIPGQPGFFVALIGQQAETPAPAGSFDPGTGNVAPIPADPGFFIGAVGQPAETPAPAGSYDPGTGNVAQILAQPGFFVALIGQEVETPAPAGTYDPGTGNFTAIVAPIGSYDPGTGNVAPIPADPGHFITQSAKRPRRQPLLGATIPAPAMSRRSPQTRATSSAQSAKRPRRQPLLGATIPAPAMFADPCAAWLFRRVDRPTGRDAGPCWELRSRHGQHHRDRFADRELRSRHRQCRADPRRPGLLHQRSRPSGRDASTGGKLRSRHRQCRRSLHSLAFSSR